MAAPQTSRRSAPPVSPSRSSSGGDGRARAGAPAPAEPRAPRADDAEPRASVRAPAAAKAEGSTRARGRPKGPFTQHRRLDALRALLQRHPKGLTIYELARGLGVTPRALPRYLSEVKREIDLVCPPERPGGPRLWRLAPNEVPRKVEVRRTQAYALLAARRLFEPMRGSTLYEEIDPHTQEL